jgi:hypothetical protein
METSHSYVGFEVFTAVAVKSSILWNIMHIQLENPYKSAMAEYSINLGCHIWLHNTSTLSTKCIYMDHIREVTEI